ncbi:MAG TPA: NmrA family NAD(P)-binding protein [Pseudonocardia sp.]
MILVTGATGKVGSAATGVLAQRGVPVRALVRDPEKAAALAQAGAEIAVGDFDDRASLDKAVLGVSTLVLVSPAVPEQELAVIAAAARAGVEHVVKATSKASPDSPVGRRRGQARIEAGLAASELAHTLLRSNAYMQNFLALAPLIRTRHRFASSAGTGRVGLIDARDVGAVAAEIAANPDRLGGRTYWLTGPELLSYGDAATTLSAVTGHEITFETRGEEQDRAAMITAGVPQAVATDNARAFSLISEGDAAWMTDDAALVLGRSPRTFREFVADHAAAFTP